MKLYERDYSILNEEEIIEWNRVKESEKKGTLFGESNKFRDHPKVARHSSLFPNNYLDIVDLKDENRIKTLAQEFLNKLEEENICLVIRYKGVDFTFTGFWCIQVFDI